MIPLLKKFILPILLLLQVSAQSNAQTPAVRGLYINFTYAWLGDSLQEDQILSYCQSNSFNYITLYDLHQLGWSNAEKDKLAAFIGKAKNQYGVQQFGASGETHNFFKNYIIPYNSSRIKNDEKFDVLNYEFEFWLDLNIQTYYAPTYLIPNGYSADTAGAFAFAILQFEKIDSLCNLHGLMSEIYLGWPERGQMQRIASIADRILLHAYRKTDADVYQYTYTRLEDIASINKKMPVMPIFSAEPEFMEVWLQSNPITLPFQTYEGYFQQATGSIQQNIQLEGYQWFLYSLMPKSSIVNASISADGPLTFCQGGNVTLTASAGASFLWSPTGDTTQSILVTSSGTYSVAITSPSGAVTTAPDVVVQMLSTGPAPVVSASGPNVFCEGGSVTLSSSFANNYLWSNGATSSTITVDSSGTFFVTTTTNGCVQSSNITEVIVVPRPAIPVISSNTTADICPGTIVTLTATPAGGYLWNNGATTRSIAVTNPGNYTVRGYAAPYCFATSDPVTLIQKTATAKPDITVIGSTTLHPLQPSAVLVSSLAPGYEWSTGQTSRKIMVSSAGTYRVSVRDTNGCTAVSDPVYITANGCTPPPVPVIHAVGSTVLLPGQSVMLVSSVGTAYLWSNGATTRSTVVNSSGDYTVRVIDSSNCYSVSLPITVTVLSLRLAQEQEANEESNFTTLELHPNPARHNVQLTMNVEQAGKQELRILDLSGRVIYRNELTLQAGYNHFPIDISALRAGLYFVQLEGRMEKIMKLAVE